MTRFLLLTLALFLSTAPFTLAQMSHVDFDAPRSHLNEALDTVVEETVVRVDPPSIVEHLQKQLRLPSPAQQALALGDVVRLTTCTASCMVQLQSFGEQTVQISVKNMTGAGTLIDLSSLVPDLRRVYDSGANDQLRLMALSSMLLIGDEEELMALTKTLSKQSERIQEVTRRPIVSYFTTAYPSLQEEVDPNGGLSIERIRKAHAEQLRADRKSERNARKAARKAVRLVKRAAESQ